MENNFNTTLPKRKTLYNSVKNIKDDVAGKHDEIIEKIHHCQNLLNTINKEKNIFIQNNKNIKKKNNEIHNTHTFNYNKELNRKKSIENSKKKKN